MNGAGAGGADWKTHETRWKYLQRVAGDHQQEVSCLNLSRHGAHLTPAALRMGTPAAVAQRVTELHLHILQNDYPSASSYAEEQGEDDSVAELPIWLDAIAETFPALRHLTLQPDHPKQQPQQGGSTEEFIELQSDSIQSHHFTTNIDKYATASDETTAPADSNNNNGLLLDAFLVRRLYVLYRLPHLESLDGIPVSAAERRLAHPRDRGQERQQQQQQASSCLLDDEEEDEEHLQQSPKQQRKRDESALAENAPVEVDVNGQPLAGSPRNGAAALQSNNNNNNSCLPLCPYDLDRVEYESVESTQVCEWGAACGALSLPYFRNNNNNKTRMLDREKAKTRFHLKLCRPPQGSNTHAATVPAPTPIHHSNMVPRKSYTSRPTDPVMHVEDMNDHGEMIFEARPQRQRSGVSLPSSPRGRALATTLRSLDYTLSSSNSQSLSSPHRQQFPPPSQSLTSPFPMQFRVRVQDTMARNLTVSTDLEVLEEPSSPPQAPRDINCASREAIEYSTVSLARVHSSPSKLSSTCLIGGGQRGDHPPPFPESEYRVTNATGSPTASRIGLLMRNCNSTTKVTQSKRRGRSTRWRIKLKARTASIMDDDEEEEEEEIIRDADYAESDSSEDDVLVLKEGQSI